MKEKMNDNEYFNVMTYGKPAGTINLIPHPEEIIDADPYIIANMKARLNNESLSNVYELSDRVFDEIIIMREKNKLKRVFNTPTQLQDAFSSIKTIRLIQEEINFEEVNRELLLRYSYSISNEKNIDEYDFYRAFLFGENLTTKLDRVRKNEPNGIFSIIVEDYKTSHFTPLKITKEAIQMNSALQLLFKERILASQFDEFLNVFYRVEI